MPVKYEDMAQNRHYLEMKPAKSITENNFDYPNFSSITRALYKQKSENLGRKCVARNT